MSMILVAVLGLLAFLLILSLFKKLIKLAFTMVTLLLIVGGIWYISQNSPEVAQQMERAKGQAADKFEEVAGEAMERATEVVKDGAGQAVEKAAEAMKDGAEQAAEAMGDHDAGNATNDEASADKGDQGK